MCESGVHDASSEDTEWTIRWQDIPGEIQFYHVYPCLNVVELCRLDSALCNKEIVIGDGHSTPSIRARHLTMLGELTLDGAYIHTSISSIFSIAEGGNLTQSFIDPRVSTLVKALYTLLYMRRQSTLFESS